VAPEELVHRSIVLPPVAERAYARLYRRQMLQADRGCVFDFLRKRPLGEVRNEQRARTAYFLPQLINGLTLGLIYGLIAIGYTPVNGINGMINFSRWAI
jgi:hypothetical protein